MHVNLPRYLIYELHLIATQQQMSACAEFKTKCQYKLINNFENDKFIKIVCSGRVFFPDGGTQGRGSDEAGEHKQTVCFRLTPRHFVQHHILQDILLSRNLQNIKITNKGRNVSRKNHYSRPLCVRLLQTPKSDLDYSEWFGYCYWQFFTRHSYGILSQCRTY